MSRRRRFLASGTEPPSEVGVKISDFSVEVGSPVRYSHGGFVRILPGQILTMACEAQGTPTPLVTWYKDDQRVTMKPGRVDITAGSRGKHSKLKITNANSYDSGTYSCHAESKHGFIKKWIVVEVNADDYYNCYVNPCLNGVCHVTNKQRNICECHFPYYGKYCENRYEIEKTTQPPPPPPPPPLPPSTVRPVLTPPPILHLPPAFRPHPPKLPTTIQVCDAAVEKSLLHAGISIASTVFVMLIIVLCYLCRLQRSKSFVWTSREGRRSRRTQACQTEVSYTAFLYRNSPKVLYFASSDTSVNQVEDGGSASSFPGCMCPSLTPDGFSGLCWQASSSSNAGAGDTLGRQSGSKQRPSLVLEPLPDDMEAMFAMSSSEASTASRRNKLNIEAHSHSSEINRAKRWYYAHNKAADVALCGPEMQESIVDDLDNGGDSGTENQQQCTCNMHHHMEHGAAAAEEPVATDADFLISLHPEAKD